MYWNNPGMFLPIGLRWSRSEVVASQPKNAIEIFHNDRAKEETGLAITIAAAA